MLFKAVADLLCKVINHPFYFHQLLLASVYWGRVRNYQTTSGHLAHKEGILEIHRSVREAIEGEKAAKLRTFNNSHFFQVLLNTFEHI